MGFSFKDALNFIPVVGPLLSAGANIIGGALNNQATKDTNDANLKAVRETNQANKELAKYNWEQQVDMWNKNNAYNTPLSQMTRLKAAGLNPNLVYGNGVTGNSSSSIPTPATPTMQAPHFERPDYGYIGQSSQAAISSALQARNLEADVSLKKSQESAIASQNLVNNAKVEEIITRNARTKFDYDLAKELRQNTVEAALLSTQQQKQKIQETANNLSLFPMQRERLKIELSLMEANRDLTVKQTEKISSEIWKMAEEVANFAYDRALKAAQTRKTGAEADVLSDPNYKQNLKAKLSGEATKALADGDYHKLLARWSHEYGIPGSSYTGMMANIANQIRKKTGLGGKAVY